MRTLAFGPVVEEHGTRRIRHARFEPRSRFPVSAACVVANAARDLLAKVVGEPVEIRLLSPEVPDDAAWSAIAEGARRYRVSGTVGEACLVLRPRDAAALASAAFHEFSSEARSLSVLEERTLGRIAQTVAGALAPAVGVVGRVAEDASELRGFATYFELQVELPFAACIGIALVCDPVADARPAIRPEALLDLTVELCASSQGVPVAAGTLAALEVGQVVPITQETGVFAAVLTIAGRPVARGECGVRGNRLALAIRLAPYPEGSSEPES